MIVATIGRVLGVARYSTPPPPPPQSPQGGYPPPQGGYTPPPQGYPPQQPQGGYPGYPPQQRGGGNPNIMQLSRLIIGIALAILGVVFLALFFLVSWVDIDNIDRDDVDAVSDDFVDANGDDFRDWFGTNASDSQISEAIADDLMSTLTGGINSLDGDGDEALTAWEVWLGRNFEAEDAENEDITFDVEQAVDDTLGESETQGFDDVRPIDRSLIIIPVLGGLIGLFGLAYVTMGSRSMGIAIVLIVLSGMALFYPFFWEISSTAAIEDGYQNVFAEQTTGVSQEQQDYLEKQATLYADAFSLAYSTGLFKVMAGIMLVLSIVLVVLNVMDQGRAPYVAPQPYYPPRY